MELFRLKNCLGWKIVWVRSFLGGLRHQERNFTLPNFSTGCLCVFRLPRRYIIRGITVESLYGVGLTIRSNSNRGRGNTAGKQIYY